MTKSRRNNKSEGKRGRKVRVDLRRNKQTRTRDQNLTHDLLNNAAAAEDLHQGERFSGKGSLTRRRTVVSAETHGDQVLRSIDATGLLEGRVTSFIGLNCQVQAVHDGRVYECTIRGVLRTLARDSRNVVITGDRVLFRQEGDAYQGVIERVEPRSSVLSRNSQGKEHVIVANIDQVLIVASAADPELKPNLIDRYLVMTERHGLDAVICINKTDLGDPVQLQKTAAIYAEIGYKIVLTSVPNQQGLGQLRELLHGRQTGVSGQSGVGKSSLLNAVDPALNLDTSDVSDASSKGRHTTRRARLVPLTDGGWVTDTPGIRQFELWGVPLEELDGCFIEFRAFVPYCRFPDCSHTHEEQCGVRDAVQAGLLAPERYQSYLRIREEDIYVWKNPARGQGTSN
ncbi:MAG: ribosome small subunit-dependent GTPase A [Planctomycetaceae bacterium]|nr:ribosome small subunit-dependent GTPase A [Planctomycetaceae bacterium]